MWVYLIVVIASAGSTMLLGRKWELKTQHYAPWSVLVSALACATVWLVARTWPQLPEPLLVIIGIGQTGLLSIATILHYFFRDPQRSPPNDADMLTSPADGRIVYIKQIVDGRFPFAVKNNNTIPLTEFADEDLIPGRGIQIGIAMNFLNVHVNRSPLAGVVTAVRRIPGRFASLKHLTSLLENERVLMVMERDGVRVGMVMIASRLVRRILAYVAEGEQVAQGQRVGMIRFGSQVDVLLAHDDALEITVQVGDEVTAGESVLIRGISRVKRPVANQEPAHAVASD
jgi:phosphatidylserine decarboxylase